MLLKKKKFLTLLCHQKSQCWNAKNDYKNLQFSEDSTKNKNLENHNNANDNCCLKIQTKCVIKKNLGRFFLLQINHMLAFSQVK